MRATKIVLAFSSVLAATALLSTDAEPRASQGRNPLDEQDVVKLLKMGVSNEGVAQLVDKYGVGLPGRRQHS